MSYQIPSGAERIEAQGCHLSDDVMPVSAQPAWRLECPSEGARVVIHGTAGKIGGDWSPARHLTFNVYHNTGHSVFFRIALRTAETQTGRASAEFDFGIFPGLEVPATLPLRFLDMQTLFLPRTPGRLKSNAWGTPTNPAAVTALELIVPPSAGSQTVWVSLPQITENEPSYDLVRNASPVVDTLGQWKQKTWTGKTESEDDLVRRLHAWRDQALEPLEGAFDSYGGWTGHKYGATGFFRLESEGDRWWLVDPLGHPFFSAGVDCVNYDVSSPMKDLEGLYEWLPPRDGVWADAWRGESLCFSTVNLIRAFGADWMAEWSRITAKRLRHWGFNTVANWSFPGFGRIYEIPYVTTMTRFPITKERIFRDFPDVFSPDYAISAAECANDLASIAADPYLIGYFMTNEPHWAFGVYNISEIMLAGDAPFVSRDRLIDFLRQRYADDPARLAEAWQTSLNTFEDLRQPIPAASKLSETAAADLDDFNRILVSEYVRVPTEACRHIAPNHLNLGLRWCWVGQDCFYGGSEYCDVFSLNHYQMKPDLKVLEEVYRKSKRPIMIGEFHAGALDAGLPANALRGVPNQHHRGLFYQSYMENAAAIPWLLGAHYFQWQDQAVLGRFDGECLNIGLVDICQRPYDDMVSLARISNARLAEIHAGLLKPTNEEPIETPKEGF